MAATTSSCVDKGFAAVSAASAPPATSVLTRFAVSAVMWRQAATRTPASGRSEANRSRIERSTGICASAHSMRARPAADAICLVAVVIGLVGALDRHLEVRGLVGRELGQVRAERLEVQPRDLLVEVLG